MLSASGFCWCACPFIVTPSSGSGSLAEPRRLCIRPAPACNVLRTDLIADARWRMTTSRCFHLSAGHPRLALGVMLKNLRQPGSFRANGVDVPLVAALSVASFSPISGEMTVVESTIDGPLSITLFCPLISAIPFAGDSNTSSRYNIGSVSISLNFPVFIGFIGRLLGLVRHRAMAAQRRTGFF